MVVIGGDFITSLDRRVRKKKIQASGKNNKYKQKNRKSKTSKKAKRPKRFFRLIILLVLIIFAYTFANLFSYFDNIDTKIMTENNRSNQEFIDSLKEISIVEYRKTGLLPSVTIAQAILESNWGRSKLTKNANNLYGIKADASWHGDKVLFNTKEYYNSHVNAYFRKYNSWAHSVTDRSNFLMKNKRYLKSGLFEKNTYRAQAQALEDAGYATTTNAKGEKIYADKLISIIKNYNLYEIDYSVKPK